MANPQTGFDHPLVHVNRVRRTEPFCPCHDDPWALCPDWERWGVTPEERTKAEALAAETPRKLLQGVCPDCGDLLATPEADGSRGCPSCPGCGSWFTIPAAVHLVVGPLEYIGLQAQGLIVCGQGAPMRQRTRDAVEATCPDCSTPDLAEAAEQRASAAYQRRLAVYRGRGAISV